MDRTIYLQTVPPAEAVRRLLDAIDRDGLIRTETVAAQDSAGRVTAAPVFARYSSPTFHSAAMDGIAVRSADTFQAREGRPVRLRKGESFVFVNTGHPLPRDMDAVVMIENVVQEDAETVAIEAPVFPWQHVRRIGEDIVATELLIPQNHTLTPYDIGALLSAGIWELEVRERVRMVIIPTGDEVLDFTLRPEPAAGQVVESNSMMLAAMARSWGCEVERIPPVPDEPGLLAEAVGHALAGPTHMVVVCAGSSAGSKDFTRSTFERFGRVVVHGISVMPGKPAILGVADGTGGAPAKILFGAPGYPVSAVVAFEDLAAPIVRHLMRLDQPRRERIRAVLNRKFPSRLGMEEVVRLAVGRVGKRYMATPLGRGAGMITTLTRAQAVTRIPPDSEGVAEGTEVEAELLVSPEALERTLVVIGSHDNTLDLLANELMGRPDPVAVTSGHVGSMGGIMALKSGSAHLAGAHLFDPATGDYNFPFLERYFPAGELTLLNLAIRHQGLMVAPGNPKGIRTVEDLRRPDVTFINRQRGAGTRILLDYHLAQASIDPSEVHGYDKEEFTHMAVAVNVLTGVADVGQGIYAAAKALGLDFVPLARERYDLLIPTAYLDDPRIQAVIETVSTPRFKARIDALGGYETTLTGQVMRPGLGLGEGAPGA